ncbi:MAG: leucine-rich repeat domain-containing protein [Clostridia bacterium]|nr:leucine-rich repeat domain-containing protein [Clostridia bacterium]
MDLKKFISGVSALTIAASAFAAVTITASAAGYTRTLTDQYAVKGYVADTLYDFQTNTPEVLPTKGDLRYRDGGIWGLYNFGSGVRSGEVSIPVEAGQIIIFQAYSGQTITSVSSCRANDSLSDSTKNYYVYNVTDDADSITITMPRYGGIVAALTMSNPNLFKWGDCTYDLNTGTLVNCETTASGSLSIPAKIKGTAITSIGTGAFRGCTGLTGVTIPSGVTSIDNYAFYGCTKLTSMTIPGSVTTIGESAFNGCTGLMSITVDENNPNYSSENGVLFNKTKTELICYPAGKKDATYNIPDSVIRIGESAFSDCSMFTSVTIPNSVTSIGSYAFSDNFSLNGIYYNGTAAQWAAVEKEANWTYVSCGTVYVLNAPNTAFAYSSAAYADNSGNDGGATGFTAELPADGTSYTLGKVTWDVMSGDVIKTTPELSYGDITVTDSSVIIGIVITGLYDPDAMAMANYEKSGGGSYIEYTE